MKETKTTYAYLIEHMTEPSFDKVRSIACDFVQKLPTELVEELHEMLNRGVDILDSEPLMQMYFYSYGCMHSEKLAFAFQKLNNYIKSAETIDLIDYGCGQGLATMCYHDYISNNCPRQQVRSITLIEPSAVAIARAELLCSCFFPNAVVTAIQKPFDELNETDINVKGDIPTIHLFSNILDVESYNITGLSAIVKSLCKGDNEFVIVSPMQNARRLGRLKEFVKNLGVYCYFEKYLDKQQLREDKDWTCSAILCSTEIQKTKNKVSIYNYSSASARTDGKSVVTGVILNAHIDSLFERYDNTELNIKDRCNRSKFIAEKIINDSNLSDKEKHEAIGNINNFTTEEEIRIYLASKSLKSNFDVYDKNIKYYKVLAISKINNALAKRIAKNTGENIKDVRTRIKKEGFDYIETSLGKEYMSFNDQNLVATYKELTQNTEEYFDELILNPKLEFLRNDRKDEFDDENEKNAVDAASDEVGENTINEETPSDDDTDITIAMYDHSGTYTSAMVHVNKDIKAYLDSLPLLNSTEKINGRLDYNLDNALGLPITMDASKCATVLYHYCNVADPNSFVQSIRDISTSLPDFAGFSVLADFLSKDETAKFAFYSVFGKMIISKVQVQQENGIRTLVISNKKSNRIDALRQELFNSVRSCLPRQDIEYNQELVTKVANYVSINKRYINKDPNGVFTKDAINKVAEIIRHYYPNIDESAISNYVYKHKNKNNAVDYIENLNTLINISRNTVKASIGSQSNYNDMLARISKANRDNKILAQKKTEMIEAGLSISNLPEKIDVLSIYSKDYMTGHQKQVAFELSNELVGYALFSPFRYNINI